MSDDDRDYYYRRAEQEIACAQASRNEEAVRVHYCLAGLYLDRVFGDSSSMPLDPAYGASA
jgi:hypothetical protein